MSDPWWSSSDEDFGGEPEISPQDFSSYLKEVEESDGFHVSVYNGVSIGLIHPTGPFPIPDGEQMWREEYEPFAKIAIEEYNKKENASLEFSELVKVNEQVTGCTIHYITLKAKNTLDGTIDTYETVVSESIGSKVVKVNMFRKKGSTDNTKRGTAGVDSSSTAGFCGEGSSSESKAS